MVQPVSYNISLNACSITNELLENGLKAQHHFVILNNWLFTNGKYFKITTISHLQPPQATCSVPGNSQSSIFLIKFALFYFNLKGVVFLCLRNEKMSPQQIQLKTQPCLQKKGSQQQWTPKSPSLYRFALNLAQCFRWYSFGIRRSMT